MDPLQEHLLTETIGKLGFITETIQTFAWDLLPAIQRCAVASGTAQDEEHLGVLFMKVEADLEINLENDRRQGRIPPEEVVGKYLPLVKTEMLTLRRYVRDKENIKENAEETLDGLLALLCEAFFETMSQQHPIQDLRSLSRH